MKMEALDINQNVDIVKSVSCKEIGSVMSQHEALRRATLIKHRKVSTQLKLDMVQRQLSHLRRSATTPDSDRRFYRQQALELSTELRDLGSSLDRAEQSAFRARSRLLGEEMTASHPDLSRSGSRGSLKHKVRHLVSSPTSRFRKRHLFGELRAVASLSSLNVKSTSPTGSEEDAATKDNSSPHRSWRSPLRFLGHLVDSRFRRKLWSNSATKRTKSADNILEDDEPRRLSKDESDENVFRSSSSEESSSSRSEEEEEVSEVEEEERRATPPRYVARAPVVRKISTGQMRAQVDPALLAEIEDFERMAAQYIKQHT